MTQVQNVNAVTVIHVTTSIKDHCYCGASVGCQIRVRGSTSLFLFFELHS